MKISLKILISGFGADIRLRNIKHVRKCDTHPDSAVFYDDDVTDTLTLECVYNTLHFLDFFLPLLLER